jgi:hypothetical protein
MTHLWGQIRDGGQAVEPWSSLCKALFPSQQGGKPAPVAHSCNPSYSGGRDQEDRGSKPAWAGGGGTEGGMAVLKFTILLLSQPPQCWDYRCAPRVQPSLHSQEFLSWVLGATAVILAA